MLQKTSHCPTEVVFYLSADVQSASLDRVPPLTQPAHLTRSADSQYSTAVINTNVIVNSNGQVTWLSHGIYQSSCDMDVEYFPFDIQSCEMKWASWTYDGYTVLLSAACTDACVMEEP